MLMSHLLRVDLVVLSVRADEADVDHPVRVVDLHHESVIVALDVEHHSVVTDDARCSVLRLDLRGVVPILLLDFAVPREKRLLRVRVQLPELPEWPFRDDPHNRSYIGPISFSSTMVPNSTQVKDENNSTINACNNGAISQDVDYPAVSRTGRETSSLTGCLQPQDSRASAARRARSPRRAGSQSAW